MSFWDIIELLATSTTLIACATPSKVQCKSCLPRFAYWDNHLVKTDITFAFVVRLGHSCTFYNAIERINPKRQKHNSNSLRDAFQSLMQVLSLFYLLGQPPGENSHNFRNWCPFATFLDYSSSYRMDNSEKPQVQVQ